MVGNILYFAKISPIIGELLVKYDTPKIYSLDPSVDIEKIARHCGVKRIESVPPEEVEGTHAIFENGVLKINREDPKGKQLFAIAHEIGHLKLDHIDTSVEYKAARHGNSGILKLLENDLETGLIRPETLLYIANEESADYFAANLLVPIDRFLLWEDKSDIEIAEAFKVEVKCIEKRRKEIVRDLAELEPGKTIAFNS